MSTLDSRERLLFAQAVYEYGNNAWSKVSSLLESHPLIRPTMVVDGIFSPDSCRDLYKKLMENEKLEITEDANGPHADTHLALAKSCLHAHNETLRCLLQDQEASFRNTVAEIDEIRNGSWDDRIRAEFPDLQPENDPQTFVLVTNNSEMEIGSKRDENIVTSEGMSSALQNGIVEEDLSEVPATLRSSPSPQTPILKSQPSPIDEGATSPEAVLHVTPQTTPKAESDVDDHHLPPELNAIEIDPELIIPDAVADTPFVISGEHEDLPQDGYSDAPATEATASSAPEHPIRRSKRRRSSQASPLESDKHLDFKQVSPPPPASRSSRDRRHARSLKDKRGRDEYSDNQDPDAPEIPTRITRQSRFDKTDLDGLAMSTPSPNLAKRRHSEVDSFTPDSTRDMKKARDDSEPFDDDGSNSRRPRQNSTSAYSTKRFQALIGMLHGQISQHRNGNIFHNPIKNSEAPDYRDIVKRPMDLKTIKGRIKDNIITNSSHFQRDIYLMFMNAMMYNRPHSDIYKMTEEMMLESETHIHTFRQTEGWRNA